MTLNGFRQGQLRWQSFAPPLTCCQDGEEFRSIAIYNTYLRWLTNSISGLVVQNLIVMCFSEVRLLTPIGALSD